MKINIILLIVVIFGIFYMDFVCAQDLIIKLQPTTFNENNIDSCINIYIRNNTEDTVFISLDPLNTDIVDSYEYRLFQTFNFYYQPNRIIFFKLPITGYFEALSSSNISFLKFPRILVLAPSNHTNIIITLGKSILNSLNGDYWEISKKICYAFKKEIYKILIVKPYYLQQEFENSLIEKDTIVLNLMYNLQVLEKTITEENAIRESVTNSVQISDPGLYYYKNSSYCKDSIYYHSIYDSIIYLFNHTL